MDHSKQSRISRPSPSQDEGFDFELTDLDEARQVLDAGSLTQFDVATAARPEHWQRLRRRRLPTDIALTGHAIDWLLALPPTIRPESLGRQFPRIANALAEVWNDPAECQAALDKLLCDGRRGRKGFPDAVRLELEALQSWTQTF